MGSDGKMAAYTENDNRRQGTYSPINAEVWFNLNSASSSVSDFLEKIREMKRSDV